MNAPAVHRQVLDLLTVPRLALQADAADLAVISVDPIRVHLALVITADTCLDCVLPRAHLQQVLLTELRRSMPSLAAVQIDDPRESAPPVPVVPEPW